MLKDEQQDAAVATQRAYYAKTAQRYDEMQVSPADEHAVALAWMAALIDQRGYKSVLDIGSGTGRVLLQLMGCQHLTLVGIEPSEALRRVGHAKGLSEQQLRAGDALALQLADDSFDIVCAFGVLHHIASHRRAVAEMCRVARRAVFISDANNFGQGPLASRIVKQGLNTLGLWGLFDCVRTGFKGYHTSEGDGVFYSYSLLGDVPLIRSKFPDVLYMSTRPSGANLYRSAQTLAIFASRTGERAAGGKIDCK